MTRIFVTTLLLGLLGTAHASDNAEKYKYQRSGSMSYGSTGSSYGTTGSNASQKVNQAPVGSVASKLKGTPIYSYGDRTCTRVGTTNYCDYSTKRPKP